MTPERLHEYANQFNSLLPLAKKAYGTLPPDDPRRVASDKVNELLREFVDTEKGNVTHLAGVTDLSLPAWRRRVRAARANAAVGGRRKPGTGHGYKDPARIRRDAARLRRARAMSPEEYRRVLSEIYDGGVSLKALAQEMHATYNQLWMILRS